jgi:UDP-N-acetylglucosamine:LPS N-acetylglucosamine transferase
MQAIPQDQQTTPKKKILIFISKGGYGHIASCNAIKPWLEQDYDVTVVNPLQDTLKELDFNRKLFNRDSEEVYNILLRSGWTSIVNFYCRHLASHIITSGEKVMRSLFSQLFQEQQPDLILSLIPFINLPASNAAAELNIPYIIVTLDHDTTMWEVGMKRTLHRNLIITVHDEERKKALLNKVNTLQPNNIEPCGFPVRSEFLQPKNRAKIKKEWNLPDNKPIILLMMGGVGSPKTKDYIKQLCKNDTPYHVVVCTGSDESGIKKLLPLIKQSKAVTFSLIPFTHRIAELMAASDLLISKTGPGTIEEALQQKLPLLLDKTGSTIFWEENNARFALKNGFCLTVNKMRDVNKKIKQILNRKNYRSMKHNLKNIQYTFNEKLDQLIKKSLETTRL